MRRARHTMKTPRAVSVSASMHRLFIPAACVFSLVALLPASPLRAESAAYQPQLFKSLKLVYEDNFSSGTINTSGSIHAPSAGISAPNSPGLIAQPGVHSRNLSGNPRPMITGTPTGP